MYMARCPFVTVMGAGMIVGKRSARLKLGSDFTSGVVRTGPFTQSFARIPRSDDSMSVLLFAKRMAGTFPWMSPLPAWHVRVAEYASPSTLGWRSPNDAWEVSHIL